MKRILLGLILLLVFTGCSNEYENKVAAFQKAIENNNPQDLLEIISLEDDLVWTEIEANQMIQYLNDNEEAYEQLLFSLHEQVDVLNEQTELDNNTGLFYFDVEGNLRVRNYQLILNDSSVENGAEIELVVNEHLEINLKKSSEEKELLIATFGPGKYDIQGKAKYEFAEVEASETFEVFSSYDNQAYIDLPLQGINVALSSQIAGTHLYIDGEKTNVLLEPGMEFGPLESGAKLQGEIELPWEKAVSAELIVEDSDEQRPYELTPVIFEGEKERGKLLKAINEFAVQRMEALVQKDIGKLKNVSDKVKNKISKDVSGKIEYRGEAIGTEVLISELGFESGYKIQLPVNFINNYSYGISDYGIPGPTEQKNSMVLQLEYIVEEEKFIVDDFGAYITNRSKLYPNGEEEIIKTTF